jgi:erythromycin esterase-like protein
MENKVVKAIENYSVPLTSPVDFDILEEGVGEAKFVLLGEASHGTSEFYTVRAELTKKLITEKDFTFVAVEGDWPACIEQVHMTKYLFLTRKIKRSFSSE